MKLTEADRRAFDIMWAANEQADPEEVDRYVREKCAELENQFVYDQEDEDDGV